VIEVFGDPSTGKSILIYKLMAYATTNGGYAVLDDVEDCYMEAWGSKLGVDNTKVIPLDSDTIETHTERVIELRKQLRKKIGSDAPIVIALDCLAALSTRHELGLAPKKESKKEPIRLI
jgi:RecA/RadA recombinase